MRLAYPIILSPFEDGSGGYTVEVPDLPGCVTEGRDLADALLMAEDAASGWVLTELEEGSPAPKASKLSGIRTESSDQLVSMVALDMDSYAAKYGSKAVRKNVTIPAWLDTWAEPAGINHSGALRDAHETKYAAQVQAARATRFPYHRPIHFPRMVASWQSAR